MATLLNQLTSLLREPWWLELRAQFPRCDYYFGPFASQDEAVRAQTSYMEDLETEGSELLGLFVMCRLPPAEVR